MISSANSASCCGGISSGTRLPPVAHAICMAFSIFFNKSLGFQVFFYVFFLIQPDRSLESCTCTWFQENIFCMLQYFINTSSCFDCARNSKVTVLLRKKPYVHNITSFSKINIP